MAVKKIKKSKHKFSIFVPLVYIDLAFQVQTLYFLILKYENDRFEILEIDPKIDYSRPI